MEHCLKAASLLPSNAHAWNYLGLAYHGAGKLAEARQAYAEALSRDRNLAAVHFNLGCLLLETEDYGGAINELTTFTLLQPQSEAGLLMLASAQIKVRTFDAAEATLKKALQINPRHVEALNNLGWVLLQKRRGREAYNQFLAAIQIDQTYAPSLLNLAIVSQQMNNRPLALKAYNDYLRHRKAPELPGPELIKPWIESISAELQPAPKPPPSHSTIGAPPEAAVSTAHPLPPPALPTSIGVPKAPPGLSPAVADPADTVRQPRQALASEPASISDRTTSSLPPQPAAPAPEIAKALSAPAPPPAVDSKAVASAPPEEKAAPPTNPPETPPKQPPPEPPAQSPAIALNKAATTPVAPPSAKAAPPESPVKDLVRLPTTTPTTPTIPEISPPLVEPQNENADTEPATSKLLTPYTVEEPAEEAAAEAPKSGFWRRVNPGRWFGGSDKRSLPPTPLRESSAPPSDSRTRTQKAARQLTESKRTASLPLAPVAPLMRRIESPEEIAGTTPTPPPPLRPRYAPRLTVPLIAGDREQSARELANGLEFRQQGRLQDAVTAYRRAVAADPRHYEARYHLALGLGELNDQEGSVSAYEAAVSLQPDAIPARYNYALTLRKLGFPEDAADQAAQILLSSPKEVRAHLLLGSLWAGELGAFPKAREHYRAVLELEPRHPQSAVIRTWLATHP